jgi:ketosteroid isomerase-like protein
LNRDVAAMERIEADEFSITHANGRVLTKADEIAGLKRQTGPRDPNTAFLTEGTKVRVYGDTAVLTGIVVMKFKDSVERSRYTDVYVKRDGRWQVVASHLSRLPEEKAATPAAATATPPQSNPSVDTKVYDLYVGDYETPFGTLHITREGDKLFGQPDNESKEELVPESADTFNVRNVGAKVKFVKGAEGRVTHAFIEIQGQQIEIKKIK